MHAACVAQPPTQPSLSISVLLQPSPHPASVLARVSCTKHPHRSAGKAGRVRRSSIRNAVDTQRYTSHAPLTALAASTPTRRAPLATRRCRMPASRVAALTGWVECCVWMLRRRAGRAYPTPHVARARLHGCVGIHPSQRGKPQRWLCGRPQRRTETMLKKISSGASRRLNDKKPLKFKCAPTSYG